MPGITRGRPVGIAIERQDEEDTRYCDSMRCLNKKHELGPRVLQEGEPEPPDYEEFKQCHFCFKLFPTYQTKVEGELYSDIETIENPFDEGKIQSLEIKKPGIKQRYAKNRDKNKPKLEKELEQELKKGGQILSYEKS